MAARRWQNRKRSGFLRAGDAAREFTRPLFTKRGFAESRLITDWDRVVGADIAAFCRPLRLSFVAKQGFGGTLSIAVPEARALEAQHLLPQIAERVNAHYGFRAVSRVAIRPGESGDQGREATRKSPQPRPEVVARLCEETHAVRDEGLRCALEKLAGNVAARTQSNESIKEPPET